MTEGQNSITAEKMRWGAIEIPSGIVKGRKNNERPGGLTRHSHDLSKIDRMHERFEGRTKET